MSGDLRAWQLMFHNPLELITLTTIRTQTDPFSYKKKVEDLTTHIHHK